VPGVRRKKIQRTAEVVVSHDGLNLGERFTVTDEVAGWVQQRVDAGYLVYVAPGEVESTDGDASQD
jgi:hypothetical protein